MKWLIEEKFIQDNKNDYPNKVCYDSLKVLTKKQRLPYSDCIVRASIGSCHQISKMGRPNLKIYLGYEKDSFNTNRWMTEFGPLALNYEHIYQTWGNIKLSFNKHSKIFIRPVSGWKTFSAGVLSENNMFDELEKMNLPNHTLCLISTAKQIQREYRFVVCGKEIVGQTEYMNVEQPIVPEEVQTYAANVVANLKNPPDMTYVLDICESDGKLYCLELNATNTAGWYAMNVPEVCERIEKFIEKQENDDENF